MPSTRMWLEWISSSLVLSEMELVSWLTLRLRPSVSYSLPAGVNLLDNDSSLVGELLKVRLERQVIVHRLDVGRQHLTTSGIGRAKGLIGMSGVTHSAIGAVSFGDLS